MKKIGLISLTVLACLSLAACGNETTAHKSSTTKTAQVHKKYYFDGKTANLKDEKITINKVSFYKGDDSTNNKNLIVFDYTITNKSDKDINAITGWQAVFNAYQDNKNTEGKLEVGPLPNDTSEEILHNQDQTIKKGGHVKCRAAYQLDSNSKPVILKAVKGYDGDFLGKKTFKLRKFKIAELKTGQTQASSANSSSQVKQSASSGNNQTKPSQSQDQRPSDVPANFKEYTSYTTDGHKMTQWNDAGSYCGDPDVQYDTIRRQTESGF